MTKEQSVLFMNILAELLCFIQKFEMPYQFIHALTGFDDIGDKVRNEMETILCQNSDFDRFLKVLHDKSLAIISKVNQENILSAYHLCIWMDQKITYEDISEEKGPDKFSIHSLIPLRLSLFVEIDALNDNYKEVGIWINPKLPIFKSASIIDKDMEQERTVASRDAFTQMNGDLQHICYFAWNDEYVVHNIIMPYEYKESGIEERADGNLRIGFIPISDKKDLIVPHYQNICEEQFEIKKMFIDHPNHEEEITTRLEKGLKLACAKKTDIVFAPEMLGTGKTEQYNGNYNMYVRRIYSEMLEKEETPPFITIMPSYWNEETNSAAMVCQDGRILGRQKKYTPYVDFKSCSMEGIRREDKKEIYLLHVYGVHRIAISICAEFIDSFDSDLICGQLGATLMIVPSYSHGEKDFINSLGTLFPYGTSVIWGDCCGAVAHSPRIIGGCSLVGFNEIHKMGDYCQCSYSCDECSGCLFLIDLPLKVIMSKTAQPLRGSVQHIMTYS